MELNIVLVVTVLILLGGAIKGFRSGFVSEVSSLLSLIASLTVVSIFIIGIKEYMSDKFVHVVVAVIILLMVVTVYKIVNFVLTSVGLIMKLPIASGVNKILGFALGGAKSVVLIWLFFILMTYFNFGSINNFILEEVNRSKFLMVLMQNNILVKVIALF